MRRKILVLMLPIFLIIVGCINRANEEEEQQMLIPREKFFYADLMQFGFRFVVDGEELNGSERYLFTYLWGLVIPGNSFDPSYNKLIFVHSQEEAVGLPDNVIAAWPSERTVDIITGLHRAIARDQESLDQGWSRRDAINIEDFGLSYPLTTTDLVNYWERVDSLWNSLSNGEQSNIIHYAQRGAPPPVIEESEANEDDEIDE